MKYLACFDFCFSLLRVLMLLNFRYGFQLVAHDESLFVEKEKVLWKWHCVYMFMEILFEDIG